MTDNEKFLKYQTIKFKQLRKAKECLEKADTYLEELYNHIILCENGGLEAFSFNDLSQICLIRNALKNNINWIDKQRELK